MKILLFKGPCTFKMSIQNLRNLVLQFYYYYIVHLYKHKLIHSISSNHNRFFESNRLTVAKFFTRNFTPMTLPLPTTTAWDHVTTVHVINEHHTCGRRTRRFSANEFYNNTCTINIVVKIRRRNNGPQISKHMELDPRTDH